MPATHHYGIFEMSGRLIGVPLEGLAEVCVVSNVSPIMDARPGLLGTTNLRGRLVPLMDLAPLFGLPTRQIVPTRAAILQHGGHIMAIAVDEIVALSLAAPHALGGKCLASEDASCVVSEGFLHGSEMVSCLDIAGLFATPGLRTIAAARPNGQHDRARSTAKLLIVSSGGASFAIDAIRVHATVPRLEINISEASTAICLGFVEYQGWKIPIVDAATVLGLGAPQTHTSAPIVILRMAEDRLLGLAVRSMERIVLTPSEGIHPSSAVMRSGGLLPSAFVSDDNTQTHIVDLNALAAVPDLVDLASLSIRQGDASATVLQATADGAVRADRQKYLLYRAGGYHATATSEIVRILVAPRHVVAVGGHCDPSIYGLFEVDGRSIPLVGIGPDRPPLSAVRFALLVGSADNQVGFAVEQITGVLQSVRRASDRVNGAEVDLVELLERGSKRLVAVTSLEAVARGLTMQANLAGREVMSIADVSTNTIDHAVA